jgi:hypothetical protein
MVISSTVTQTRYTMLVFISLYHFDSHAFVQRAPRSQRIDAIFITWSGRSHAPKSARKGDPLWTWPRIVHRKPTIGSALRRARGRKKDRGRQRWALAALIGGAEPHDHLSRCLSHPLQSLSGWPSLGKACCPLATAEAVGDQWDWRPMIYGTSHVRQSGTPRRLGRISGPNRITHRPRRGAPL